MAQTPNPKPDCKDVIAACDKALSEKNKALQLSDLALKSSMDNAAKLQTTVNDRDAELNSFYRNPVVMLAIGFVMGTVTYVLIKR